MNFARLAIDNVSKQGDTDIFPYPVENMMFFDCPDKIEALLLDIEKNFEKWLSEYPIEVIQTFIPVGYTGYRWVTMIDPLWNTFLLYQVLKIADKIESSRIAKNKGSVFSYRIKINEDNGKLFDTEINWRLFYETALKDIIDSGPSYVVRFDISDFYNRIYHHRLENAIIRIGADHDIKIRIMKILQDISNNDSYGLPIGGNASRILAELLLNSMDQMLVSKRFKFYRFVDDYIVFANDIEDAYKKLIWCADFMLRNWGLTQQKSKTQIQQKSEFIGHVKAMLEGDDNIQSRERSDFLKLRIHYDPYSVTAKEDYKNIREQLEGFDISSLIKNEIRKSRINLALGKQLMSAILYLENEKLDLAIKTICSNLIELYPVLPNVLQVLFKKISELSNDSQIFVINEIAKHIEKDSYLFQTENNAAYAVRLFSLVNTEIALQAIESLYSKSDSVLVRYNCIYAMTNLNNHYWIANLKSKFNVFTSWERRAFIAASYFLREEGKHWRNHTKEQFSKFELQLRDWIASKDVVNGWRLPL
jgi:hypothetical protein